MIVSVFYYKPGEPQMRVAYLEGVERGEGGRVVLPQSFRRGKKIMAVRDGKYRLLNRCGDRTPWKRS